VALFEALYMHFPGGSEKTDTPPSRWTVGWLAFDYSTSSTEKESYHYDHEFVNLL